MSTPSLALRPQSKLAPNTKDTSTPSSNAAPDTTGTSKPEKTIPTTAETKALEDAKDTPSSHGVVDPDDNVRHPLQHKWTLHYDSGAKGTGPWGSNIKAIADFANVEDFWRLYNNIVRPSNMGKKASFSLFKAGVKPMWEDEFNTVGGMWAVVFSSSHENDKQNQAWLYSLLGMIGEQFGQDAGQICGANFACRTRGNRIQLWTKTAKDEQAVMRIGRKWKELMELQGVAVRYQSHEDAYSRERSKKYLYELGM